MVRRQHHQARLGIASQNPVSRQQDGRCGTPIFGLLQHMERRRFVAELLGQVRRLSGHGHHDRSPGRDTCAHPFERLT